MASNPEPLRTAVELAVEAAGYSPCRSKRGAVIFRGDRIISYGFNQKPGGFACDGSSACKATCRSEAVHAEQDALIKALANEDVAAADMLHVKVVAGQLVPSGGPSCVQCSKLALAAGIGWFWLYHDDGWKRYPIREFHALSITGENEQASVVASPARPRQEEQHG